MKVTAIQLNMPTVPGEELQIATGQIEQTVKKAALGGAAQKLDFITVLPGLSCLV